MGAVDAEGDDLAHGLARRAFREDTQSITGYAEGGVAIAYGPSINVITPVPVAPGDIVPGSIFAEGAATGQVYALPGTIVDWSTDFAQSQAGGVTVLEMRGLEWTQAMAMPYVGQLLESHVAVTCPAFGAVLSLSLLTDLAVSVSQPLLTPQAHGQAVHTSIKSQAESWGANFKAEFSLLAGDDQHGAQPLGSSVLDILEKVGNGTVCVYDIKTGTTPMSTSTMERYWREVREFDPTATHILIVPIYVK